MWNRIIVTDVLGKDELPPHGEPKIMLRIDYAMKGKPKGWLELAKGQGALLNVYGRSVNTAGWVVRCTPASRRLRSRPRRSSPRSRPLFSMTFGLSGHCCQSGNDGGARIGARIQLRGVVYGYSDSASSRPANYTKNQLQLILGAWVLSTALREDSQKISVTSGDVAEGDYDKREHLLRCFIRPVPLHG